MHKQPFVTPYTLNLVLTGSDFPHSPSSKIIVLNCVMFIATYNYLPTLYVLLIIAMYQKRLAACKANSKCSKCVYL